MKLQDVGLDRSSAQAVSGPPRRRQALLPIHSLWWIQYFQLRATLRLRPRDKTGPGVRLVT